MIVLKKLRDLKKYYNAKENSYKFQESIQITFNLKIEASLIVKGDIYAKNINAKNIYACDIAANNINAGDIDACDIYACDIAANNINAGDIDACDIAARDINAWDIDASNINAKNINARNIKAWKIDALDIEYFAFVVAYKSFKCVSTTARRENGIALCLDQPIFYKDKENK